MTALDTFSITLHPESLRVMRFWLEHVFWLMSAWLLVWLWYSGGLEQRRLTILTFLGMVAALLAALLLTEHFNRASASADVRYGFPSAQTAFWFALIAGLFYHNRRMAGVAFWGGVIMGFGLVLVAYQYPSDVIAGASIGIIAFHLIYALRGWLRAIIDSVSVFIESVPALTYPVVFLLLLDMSLGMTVFVAVWRRVFNV